jgi:hypothetical protein
MNDVEKTYKVKKGLEVSTGDFWYDLSLGGYIDPNEILENTDDIEEVKNAIRIVKKFERSCEEQIENFVI